ncbi:TPA: restriction endonuclease subunit S [Escherichia coli]|nr:type II restriction endonuclease subunit R [Escherichia coli]EFG2198331.1 type II restriction endonuclease subunit R [Escherichia coli]EFP2078468.1 type II restriction endonuclease subunit R [Escherichia coli]EKA9548335.1 restriction endonuclease subunit S [Escherichia coli]HAN5606476.1 type II restriction endonuclease subunit R [Escherichia coli]
MGDLFYVSTGSLISSGRLKPGKIKRVSAKSDQNGIIGEFDTEFMDDARHYENFISVNFFGDAFYHPYCASVEMKVHVLTLKSSKSDFNAKRGLYVASMINKALKGRFNYGQQLSSSKLRDGEYFISLPVKNNEIDWFFMDNYIEELEAAHIEELEAYLLVSGLADSRTRGLISYELTPQEYNAIELLNSNNLMWGTYNLKKLFGPAIRGKRLKNADRIPGSLPFVTAGEGNEGISAFISNDVVVFPENTITIDMFGSAKYRNYEYGADDHVAVVHTEFFDRNAVIFITASIHKSSCTGKFNYGRNFYAKDADELMVSLPSKDNNPDYSFMETLILAVHKLVIKDVVQYTDKKLVAYRQITSEKVV